MELLGLCVEEKKEEGNGSGMVEGFVNAPMGNSGGR